MKGTIRLPVIVLCTLLLLGPAPAAEPVQAKLELQAVPEGLYSLHSGGCDDDVESAATLTGQDPFAVAAPVETKLEPQAVPEDLYSLHSSGRDDVESAAAFTGQDPFAAAALVKTTTASGCDDSRYYATIHSGDIDGDRVDELLARTPTGMEAWRFNTTSRTWVRVASGGPFSDGAGWGYPKYYATIHSGDIDGDGVDELLARGADGMQAWRFTTETSS